MEILVEGHITAPTKPRSSSFSDSVTVKSKAKAKTTNSMNTNMNTKNTTRTASTPSPSPSIKMKQRSWSMLELTEMEVIHKLEDDMQDMLSIEDEEAAPASFLSLATGTGKATATATGKGTATAAERTKPEKSPKASSNGFGFAAMEALHEDHDEDEFLFYDDDDNDDDDDDEEVLPVRVVEEERNAGKSSDEKVNFLFYDVADDDEDEEVVVHVKEERNDDNILDAVNTDTTNTAADQRPHTLTTRTTTTLHKKNDDSASTSTSASDQAPKHIREDEKSKKKFKKNIFKKIGMKKSISMGMFSKHWNNDVEVRSSLDVSVHRRTETLSLEFDDDEHEHENEHEHEHEHEYMEKVKFSLDDSSHGRQIDLGTGTSRGGTNMNTRTRSIPRTDLVSSSAIPTTSKSPSFSPNSIADMMTSPEEPPPLPPPLMRTPATLTKISNADNATADSADDSLSAFKHCPKKKPAQSILRKATSMLNLSSLATNPSASISTSAHASSAPLTPAFASNNAAINNRKQMKRTTSFSTLEIREYNITIGDNPGGKAGPPISLDWNYSERNTVRMCIDKYEKTRPPRRARHEMYMPGKIRMWTLLKELGYTLRDIDSASKAADSIRKKRQKSIKYKGIHDLQYKVGKIMSRGGRGAGVA